MSTYHIQSAQQKYPSTDFVESAGCILFDFRETWFGPQRAKEDPPQPQPQSALLPTDEAPVPSIRPKIAPEPKVVLVRRHTKPNHTFDKYLLPKGRRNIGESRKDAAIRETFEETGLKCELLPVTLQSRATSVDASRDRQIGGYTLDEVRMFTWATDPFCMTLRALMGDDGGQVTKVVWWFVGVVCKDQGSEEEVDGRRKLDQGCEAVGVRMGEAAGRCTWLGDGDVVRQAVELVRGTFGI